MQTPAQAPPEELNLLLQRIYTSLRQHENEIEFPGLFQGRGGIGLFYAYYFLYTQNQAVLDSCITMVEKNIDDLSGQIQLPGLGAGFTGSCWLFKHLINLGLLDTELEDELQDIHASVRRSLSVDFQTNTFDLLYGYLGKGVYFSERADAPAEQDILLQQICKTAIRTDRGVYWDTHSSDGVNLGLAHGIPSLLVFLARFASPGLAPVQDILRQAVRWLLTYEQTPTHVAQGYFPHHAESTTRGSRLAWCFGDLGVAWALVSAAHYLADETLRQKAARILAQACARTLETSGIIKESFGYDPGFCHGSSGIFYLFSRLAEALPEVDTHATCQYWLQQTMRHTSCMLDSFDTIAEKTYFGTHAKLETTGLVNGLSGAGLVLLSVCQPSYQGWNRLFLLNEPV